MLDKDGSNGVDKREFMHAAGFGERWHRDAMGDRERRRDEQYKALIEQFKAADADQSGDLDLSESQFALQAFGLYPKDQEIEEMVEELGLHFPLGKPAFLKLAGALDTSGCALGLRTVPYARRGVSLRQLKAVRAALMDSKWLPSLCEGFNQEHEAEIR